MTLGNTIYYTDQRKPIFVAFFKAVAELLGATASTAANYADKVWQLEKAMAEVMVSARRCHIQ